MHESHIFKDPSHLMGLKQWSRHQTLQTSECWANEYQAGTPCISTGTGLKRTDHSGVTWVKYYPSYQRLPSKKELEVICQFNNRAISVPATPQHKKISLEP
jgi:hypothetical protein